MGKTELETYVTAQCLTSPNILIKTEQPGEQNQNYTNPLQNKIKETPAPKPNLSPRSISKPIHKGVGAKVPQQQIVASGSTQEEMEEESSVHRTQEQENLEITAATSWKPRGPPREGLGTASARALVVGRCEGDGAWGLSWQTSQGSMARQPQH